MQFEGAWDHLHPSDLPKVDMSSAASQPGIPAVNAWGNDIQTVFSNANYWSAIYKSFFGG